MAASDPPTDETIDNFISFAGGGIDRRRAVRILKFHNNDVEKAINDYFDDPDSSKYDHSPPASQQNQRWDEQAFHSDRDGSSNNTGISFTIEGSDELPPLYGPQPFENIAPSRPPSRTSNNRSPHNVTVIDMTAQHAAADPSTSKTYDLQNDPELAQAIAASMQPQETGITSTDQAAFGPANRIQYEPGKWDLVPVSTSAREILLDPEPEDRKRDLGVPAFLKPSADDNRLAALLTIYHEIPMIREMFLDRANVIANYGTDREWWTGKPIETPTITGAVEDEQADFVHELQRLMAFLDKTERSYGSAEVLARLPYVRRYLAHERDLESAVLEAYKSVFSADNQAKIKRLFSKGVDGPEELSSKEFAILELPLPKKDACAETIYDIADSVLWESTAINLDCSPFLSNIGEIITFRFTGWDESKKNGVAVPAVWYPDRYLESGRQAALDMRLRKQDIESDLEKIDMLENGLTYHDLRSGKRIKIEELFKAALQHDQDEIEDDPGTVNDNMEESMMYSHRSANSKNLSAELRKLADRIDHKLLALGKEKDKAREAMRKLSKLYTQQSDDPNQPSLHKYTLRGVSTCKTTMYICRQAEPDLIDMNLGSDDPQPTGDQWWKIQYAISESKPVNVEKTTEEKVLEAASASNSSLLVYASEKAMSATQYPLAVSLETFVRKDNVWFKHEFPAPNSAISSPKSPSSPSKRKTETTESSDEASQEGRYRSFAKISEEDGDESGIGAQSASSNLTQVVAPNGKQNHEMIMGIDPNLHENSSPGQEMQERSSMRMLSSRARDGAENPKPIDSMDLDQVMEDENIAQESGAVSHIGYLD